MAAAIETYNRPTARYRTESFTILAINAWELLLKAKWLKKHGNKMRCLYVAANNKQSAKGGRPRKYKTNKSGNYITAGLDHVMTQLSMTADLDRQTCDNLVALTEIRDAAVHLFNRNIGTKLELLVQELGMACVHNFAIKCKEWFDRDLVDLDTFIMPLAFINSKPDAKGAIASKEANNISDFVSELCKRAPTALGGPAITINLSFKLDRRNTPGSALFTQTNDPSAARFGVPIKSELLAETFNLSYDKLTEKCRLKLHGFRTDDKYHRLRKQLAENESLAWRRPNNPTKPNGKFTTYFSEKMFAEISKHYDSK